MLTWLSSLNLLLALVVVSRSKKGQVGPNISVWHFVRLTGNGHKILPHDTETSKVLTTKRSAFLCLYSFYCWCLFLSSIRTVYVARTDFCTLHVSCCGFPRTVTIYLVEILRSIDRSICFTHVSGLTQTNVVIYILNQRTVDAHMPYISATLVQCWFSFETFKVTTA